MIVYRKRIIIFLFIFIYISDDDLYNFIQNKIYKLQFTIEN